MSHRVKKLLLVGSCCLLFFSRTNAWVVLGQGGLTSSSQLPLRQRYERSSPYTKLTAVSHSSNNNDSSYKHDRPLQRMMATAFCWLMLSCSAAAAATPKATYWDIQTVGTSTERVESNKALVEYVMGTVNTHYYDATGGARFQPLAFYRTWRGYHNTKEGVLATREGTVDSLRWLVERVGDPYSKYLTREELRAELVYSDQGFLGSGAIVEPSTEATTQFLFGPERFVNDQPLLPSWKKWTSSGTLRSTSSPLYLTSEQVDRLPVITAITPNSPAEHAGLTVGDRIVAVGNDSFLEKDQKALQARLGSKYHAENYFGKAYLTIAKPKRALFPMTTLGQENNDPRAPNIILGYRSAKVQLPSQVASIPRRINGDSIVQFHMLRGSIFDETSTREGDVGYIRLTRFSKRATAGFFKAVEELERQGASAYILDLRNNYGGIIQEAMLTASTLLRDPNAILCYTLNSLGEFTPHDVAEYVDNDRYPGYLLSTESRKATSVQARHDHVLQTEHGPKRHGHARSRNLVSYSETSGTVSARNLVFLQQLASQKDIVLLINEGTASSAEVFSSALHDNGRVVALVGSKSYGKGLVQHTFPLPDGGGLRLTVAEYLRPSLQHVSRVGGAQFDQTTGQWIGGGIQPDIYCDSKQGIPSNIGADLCVGVALDALEEAQSSFRESRQLAVKRVGGVVGGSAIR